MKRWVAVEMARRYREVAADFRRYPGLAMLADKMERDAAEVLSVIDE